MRMMLAVTGAVAALLADASAELKGDAEAIARVDSMIERLGGADIWASARTLTLVYHGWRTEPSEPVIETAIRDLIEPVQQMTFEGRSFVTTFAMTPKASWLVRTNGVRRFTEDEHALNVAFFDFDFYTILRNLAAGDDRISVRAEGERIVRLTGPEGADWGWFEIDATGQPVRWGASYGDEPLEYLYGPVKSFGNINFPAWGTASDGSWRFDYDVVDVDREAPDLNLTPPRR